MRRRTGFLCLVILRRMRVTSLGVCLMVIVNESLNLEKLLLIYGCKDVRIMNQSCKQRFLEAYLACVIISFEI